MRASDVARLFAESVLEFLERGWCGYPSSGDDTQFNVRSGSRWVRRICRS